jgi:hypothetical protein
MVPFDICWWHAEQEPEAEKKVPRSWGSGRPAKAAGGTVVGGAPVDAVVEGVDDVGTVEVADGTVDGTTVVVGAAVVSVAPSPEHAAAAAVSSTAAARLLRTILLCRCARSYGAHPAPVTDEGPESARRSPAAPADDPPGARLFHRGC